MKKVKCVKNLNLAHFVFFWCMTQFPPCWLSFYEKVKDFGFSDHLTNKIMNKSGLIYQNHSCTNIVFYINQTGNNQIGILA